MALLALFSVGVDTCVVMAVDTATTDLSRIEVNDGCHPGFVAVPRRGVCVFEVPDGMEAVFIDAEHPRSRGIIGKQLTSSVSRQASFTAAQTIHRSMNHPPGYNQAGRGLGCSPTRTDHRINQMLPKAAGGACLGGTWLRNSKNDSRWHSNSWQYQEYLRQTTSMFPATGMSRMRCKRRFFLRVATNSQPEHPNGCLLSTRTWWAPSGVTDVDMTW